MKYDISKINTFAELKNSGYKNRSVKDEMRENLIYQLKNGQQNFRGIIGYEETVIPDIQSAVLSRHNIILLGLRGQAKTRIARLMVSLLDEYLPIIEGSELNDNPFHPISRYGKDKIEEMGDDTPIHWISREERYAEKLATPDVTIADLIGDVDPIKAASLKLPYSDERVIHFGLIPRSHRGIFAINELPDLQARIQVALFNILQEKDVQIRGFNIRLPLDVQFVFPGGSSVHISFRAGLGLNTFWFLFYCLVKISKTKLQTTLDISTMDLDTSHLTLLKIDQTKQQTLSF